MKPGALFLSNDADATSGGANTVGVYVITGRFKFPKTLSKKNCVFDFKVGALGGVLTS